MQRSWSTKHLHHIKFISLYSWNSRDPGFASVPGQPGGPGGPPGTPTVSRRQESLRSVTSKYRRLRNVKWLSMVLTSCSFYWCEYGYSPFCHGNVHFISSEATADGPYAEEGKIVYILPISSSTQFTCPGLSSCRVDWISGTGCHRLRMNRRYDIACLVRTSILRIVRVSDVPKFSRHNI